MVYKNEAIVSFVNGETLLEPYLSFGTQLKHLSSTKLANHKLQAIYNFRFSKFDYFPRICLVFTSSLLLQLYNIVFVNVPDTSTRHLPTNHY
uniref:Uncharacterized protein n=1 Tax=Oryza brachyantha TaxID=4533 RepID=J3L605_ORYBR